MCTMFRTVQGKLDAWATRPAFINVKSATPCRRRSCDGHVHNEDMAQQLGVGESLKRIKNERREGPGVSGSRGFRAGLGTTVSALGGHAVQCGRLHGSWRAGARTAGGRSGDAGGVQYRLGAYHIIYIYARFIHNHISGGCAIDSDGWNTWDGTRVLAPAVRRVS